MGNSDWSKFGIINGKPTAQDQQLTPEQRLAALMQQRQAPTPAPTDPAVIAAIVNAAKSAPAAQQELPAENPVADRQSELLNYLQNVKSAKPPVQAGESPSTVWNQQPLSDEDQEVADEELKNKKGNTYKATE